MSKPMIAISNHSIMLGGGEHSFLDLLSRLSSTWKLIAVVPEEGELAARLQKKKIETYTIPLPALRPWLAHRILSSFRAYFAVCKKRRPNLIYANGSRAAFYGNLIGRLLHIPVIWHCRIAERDPILDFLLGRLSTKIVVNSKATANRFGPSINGKLRIVYNGVDIDWFEEKCAPKPELVKTDWIVILIVARISRQKRHDLALSAFEHIAVSNSKIHLFCVGSKDPSQPEWYDYLQEISDRSSVSNRIHWIDHVDDIRSWYRVASILVLPSENEGFGRVLIEAMTCGVPVVASRSGGVPEIVRHGQDGFLVTPGKVDEIVNAIGSLLKEKTARKHYAQAAIKRASFFSLDVHVSKMVEIFKNTINT